MRRGHIDYENESVRKVFNDFNSMKKKIGNDKARAMKKRLDQLRAAISFSIFLTTGLGKPHPLYENLRVITGYPLLER